MGYHSDASWFSLVQAGIIEARLGQFTREHPAPVLRGIAQPRAKRLVGA
jgi:hypothetical protein